MKFLEKIKQTEIYQVYFVRAMKKSKKKVLFSYQLCLVLLVFVYTLIPNITTEFKPRDQLRFLQGTLIESHKGGRGFNEGIVIETKNEILTFGLPLSKKSYEYIKNNLQTPVIFDYHYEYKYWPFKSKRILYLSVNGKVINNYSQKYIDWLGDNSLTKKTIIFCLIVIGIILLRIWKKYK